MLYHSYFFSKIYKFHKNSYPRSLIYQFGAIYLLVELKLKLEIKLLKYISVIVRRSNLKTFTAQKCKQSHVDAFRVTDLTSPIRWSFVLRLVITSLVRFNSKYQSLNSINIQVFKQFQGINAAIRGEINENTIKLWTFFDRCADCLDECEKYFGSPINWRL